MRLWPTTTRWLHHAQFRDGLLVPGRSAIGHAADLRLSSEGGSVTHRGETVGFPWESYGSWRIREWNHGRGGDPIGVAVHLSGPYADATEAMRRRTRLPGFHWASQNFKGKVAVPLWPASFIRPGTAADLTVLDIMCVTLRDHPALRARLDDPVRVERLISDIIHTPHNPKAYKTGFTRSEFEILHSMHLLGYEHARSGRPLPDGTVISLDDVTARVIGHIRANPWAKGVALTDDFVRRIVEKDYVGVAPWPLRALFD